MTERVYTVTWTETALTLAEAIPDQRVKRGLHDRAGQLANSPEQQGKALVFGVLELLANAIGSSTGWRDKPSQ
jgi:hypothetical protein